jgi:roadblock/LC7 domain-containing protein|nr:MAG TPA: tail tape measure [Caudoviricetes sp.]
MATIADLLVKLGADSSGLRSELNKAKSDINSTFDANPLRTFQGAVDGTAGSMEKLISNFGKFTAAAGAGFGFIQLISGAVEAGARVKELSETMGISAAQASMFSKTVSLAGGDVQTASAAIMRLDKTLSAGGASAEKAQDMLDAVGVSLQDANGKLLPVNEQLKALSEGYKAATSVGYGQEYLMETLGARGIALTGVLREYTEAAQNAAKVQSVGLDPEEMDRTKKEIDVLKMQASTLGTATGAALAPIIEQIIPPLTSGLASIAQYLATNKEEVIDCTKALVGFIAAYKTVTALRASVAVLGGLMGAAGTGAASTATDAITRAQEAQINKRIRLIENAALQEEKAYLKSLQTMEVTEAEKTRLYANYVRQRQAETAKAAAVIRAEMTKTYAEINSAATTSAAVQTGALNSVSKAAVVSGAAVGSVGGAAINTGVKMTTMGSTGLTTMKKLTSAAWALAGGWLGVASAIIYALGCLVEYKKQKAEKELNDQVINIDGEAYKQIDGVWKKRVVNTDASDFENPFSYEDVDQKSSLVAELNNRQYMQPDLEKTELSPEANKQLDDLKAQLEGLSKSVDDNTAAAKAGGGGGTSTPKVEVPKTYTVEVPLGEIAAQKALDAYNAAPGSQWLNPDLTNDMENSCASFVSTMYGAAGVMSDLTASGNNLDAMFQSVKGAWFGPNDGYSPSAGDYVSSPGHVGMYVGNNTVISRDSKGGLQQHDLDQWKQEFGFIGYGSVAKLTGGATATQTVDKNGKALQEAQKKLQKAKDEALKLFTSMSVEIEEKTGTAYEAGMAQVAENVKAKGQEIQKLAAAGLPTEAVKSLQDKLSEYQTALQNKVTQQQQEALNKLKTDTARTTAELKGDYKSLADAEYNATVEAINKEKEERTKAVAQNKDDKEAMAAVEDWYTSQVQAAAEKRTEAYRASFAKQMDYAISHHDTEAMGDLLNSDNFKQMMDWDGQTAQMQQFYDLWKDAHKTTAQMMADSMSSFQGSISDFFTNILEGQETFGDAFLDMVDSLLDTVVKQLADKWSSQILTSLFPGMFGGDQQSGDLSGGSGGGGLFTGLSFAGGLLGGGGGGLFGGLFGGGSNGNGDEDPITTFQNTINRMTTGMDTATNTLSLFSGGTGTAGKLLGTYNIIQGAINTGTKPAETATTVAATTGLAGFTTSVYMATAALQAMAASKFATFGFATGGYIAGPGTGTSDSIPAFLSNGEYVLTADAVQNVGLPLLDAVNSGRVGHFATGGLVRANGSGSKGTAVPVGNSVTLNVSALDAASFMEFLQNGGMDIIKQLLFDGDRDFTTKSGVW